jgi:tetratricopeptide (TPR) repeat protein
MAAAETAADAVRDGAMHTRYGTIIRAASTLALLGALAGASHNVEAQTPASVSPLVIVPMSSDPDLPTSRPPDFLSSSRPPDFLSSSRPPDTLVAQGHALYDAGRYKEAAASFERAMQLGVARPHEAARNVARSYAKLGNRKQAVRWAEIAELLEHPERAPKPLRSRLLLKI